MQIMNARQGHSLLSRPYLLTLATIIIMSEIVSIICLREIESGIWFTLFQVIDVLVPGTACLMAGGWSTGLNWNACAFSYVIGYCLSLFVYFAIMLCGAQLYVKYIIVFVFLLSCMVIISKRKYLKPMADDPVSVQWLILFSVGIMFGIVLITSCCTHLLPPVVQDSSPGIDMLYWVGNIIELTREFPPKDFRDYPAIYSYHYFSSAQLALASLFTKIRPVYIGLYFSVIQSVLLRVFCGYLVLEKCTKKLELQIIGMILLFFSSGFEEEVVVTYLSHSYYSPFGMDYGLAVYLIFIYLMLVKYEEEINQVKTSILIWICIFVLAGEKVSYAGVGLFGLGVLCIGSLIKKEYKKAIVTGIPACCIFVVEYFSIINLSRFVNNPVAHHGGNSFIPIWSTAVGASWVPNVNNIFGFMPPVATLILVLAFISLGSPVCFFSVLYNSWRITKYASWNLMDVSLLSMYFVGFCTWIFVQMYGWSNMYFAFASFPVAIIWLVKCKLPWSRNGMIAFAITAIFSITGFVNGATFNQSLFDFFSHGMDLIVKGKVKPKDIDNELYVDMESYKAYEWIRAHSEQDNIIATNRVSGTVGVMTERYINNPKWGKISVYAKETDVERRAALSAYRDMGVKYIMFEKKYGEKVEFLERKCNVVYQSENITIYDVP